MPVLFTYRCFDDNRLSPASSVRSCFRWDSTASYICKVSFPSINGIFPSTNIAVIGNHFPFPTSRGRTNLPIIFFGSEKFWYVQYECELQSNFYSGFKIDLVPTSAHNWTYFFSPTTATVSPPSAKIEHLFCMPTLMSVALIVVYVYRIYKLSAKVHFLVFAVLLFFSGEKSAVLCRWSALDLCLFYFPLLLTLSYSLQSGLW